MKIIVLGGFGFIGKSVMTELQSRKYSPVALSRRNGFDLLDYENARKKLEEVKPDIVINCSAHVGGVHYVYQYASDVFHDNMQMVLNIYKMVTEVCPGARVINPIANCSYPGTANIHIESEWWDGPVHDSVLAFGNTRRMMYVVSKCYERQHNISSVNFLVPGCVGAGDYTDPNITHALAGMIIRMLQAQKEGKREFEVWGTGKPTREWVYVGDVAQMMCNAIDFKESQIEPVNFAQNRAYSIKETAEMIKELIGFDGKLVFNTSYQDGAPTKRLDNELFRRKYPDFVFTDLKIAVKEAIDYYKAVL